VSEITNEQMLEMLATTKAYTLMVLRQGPNYDAPGRDEVHPVRGFPGSTLPA
jgi:hypothetical protein